MSKNIYVSAMDRLTVGEERKERLIGDLIALSKTSAPAKTMQQSNKSHRVWKKGWAALPIAAVAVFCAIFLPLMLRDNTHPDNGKQGLSAGFSISTSDPIPGVFCAYKTDTNEFEINDVKISYFYGTHKRLEDFGEYEQGADVVLRISFYNDENQEYFVKDIINEFFTDKYSIEYINAGTEVGFSYSEKLTIPASMFTAAKGFINFVIFEYIVWKDGREPERQEGNGIKVYYQLDGNLVKLSKNPIV